MEEQNNKNLEEWMEELGKEKSHKSIAKVAAKFMFASAYYHDRMKLHIMLHPLFFLAGFIAAYFAFGGHNAG